MSRFAARLVNRFGTCRVIIIGYILLLLQCFCWIFMPSTYCWQMAVLPFILIGFTSVAVGNASSQYFLRSLPIRHQVAASIFSALIHGAGAGFVGLMLASGTMKLAQMVTASPEPYTVFRVYFVLAFAFLMIGGLYPVIHIKRFIGENRA